MKKIILCLLMSMLISVCAILIGCSNNDSLGRDDNDFWDNYHNHNRDENDENDENEETNANGNPVDEVITLLEEGEFEKALDLSFEFNTSALIDVLIKRIEAVENRFLDDEVEYENVLLELDTIEQMAVYETLENIDRTREFIREINISRIAFNTAETFFARGEYLASINFFKQVIQNDPSFETALEMIINATNAFREVIISEVNENVEDGNYTQAISILRNGLRDLEDDQELSRKLNVVTHDFIVSTIEEANALRANNDFNGAIARINSALNVVPENEQLMRALSEIQGARPVRLLSLTPTRTEGIWRANTAQQYASISRGGAEFFLDGQYSLFRGRVSTEETLDPRNLIRFVIRADGIEIYRSDYIARATSFDFEVDISGVRFISITAVHSESVWGNVGHIIASNLYLVP